MYLPCLLYVSHALACAPIIFLVLYYIISVVEGHVKGRLAFCLVLVGVIVATDSCLPAG